MNRKEIKLRMKAIVAEAELYLPDLNSGDAGKVREARAKHSACMTEFDALTATLEAQDAVASHAREATQGAGDVQFEELAGNVSMGDYTRALLSGHLEGAASELNEELRDLGTTPTNGGVVVPWQVLERAARGSQVRAVTGTGQIDAADGQRPILGRVFAPSLAGSSTPCRSRYRKEPPNCLWSRARARWSHSWPKARPPLPTRARRRSICWRSSPNG